MLGKPFLKCDPCLKRIAGNRGGNPNRIAEQVSHGLSKHVANLRGFSETIGADRRQNNARMTAARYHRAPSIRAFTPKTYTRSVHPLITILA
jgi:hypothetical protein